MSTFLLSSELISISSSLHGRTMEYVTCDSDRDLGAPGKRPVLQANRAQVRILFRTHHNAQLKV
jgi:hypothetical protein